MRRWTVGVLSMFALSGCYKNTVEPTDAYSTPESIPRAEFLEHSFLPGGAGVRLVWENAFEWGDTVFSVIDGYAVERAKADSAFAPPKGFIQLNGPLLLDREFTDSEFLPEGWFAYQVVGVTPAGVRSLPSNVLYVRIDRTPPETGPVLTARVVGVQNNLQVDLSWTKPVPDVVDYKVYRVPAYAPSVDFVLWFDNLGFTDFGVLPDSSYTYWVVARDAAGNESPQSNQATVLIVAP